MEQTYRVGTRKSPLALKQVKEVISALNVFYPTLRYEIIGIDTYGDKDKTTPISEIEGTDFFTREIDEALLNGDIEFAVHSAKDLPDEIPEGLVVATITKSIDLYDALVLRQSSVPALSVVEGLVSKENLRIDQLKKGARIGASSLRRKTQLKRYREDLQIVDIRGNIEERLRRLDFGYQPSTINYKLNLDAIIVASCALVRLGLEDRIAQRIPFEILRPHPLQGSLAIEVRKNNKELMNLLKVLNEK